LLLGICQYTAGTPDETIATLSTGLELVGCALPTSSVSVVSLIAKSAASEMMTARSKTKLHIRQRLRASTLRPTHVYENDDVRELCVEAYGSLAQTFMLTGRSPAETISALLLMRREAIRTSLDSPLAHAKAWLATASAMFGSFKVARHFHRGIVELCERNPDDKMCSAAEG
jgi:hypothetical protein